MRQLIARLGLIATTLCLPFTAVAQADAPVPTTMKIVVPFGPGASNDAIARAVAPLLAKRLGNTVIVENKAGAAGTIGTHRVARAAADGHTLLFAVASPLNVAPLVAPSAVKYDTFKDFVPLATAAVDRLLHHAHVVVTEGLGRGAHVAAQQHGHGQCLEERRTRQEAQRAGASGVQRRDAVDRQITIAVQVGLQGRGTAHWVQHDLPRLRARGARVVASIWGFRESEYEQAARDLVGVADQLVAVEVNLSCPNVDHARGMFAHSAVQSAQVVAAVRRVLPATVGVWAKLSPNTDQLVSIAGAVVAAGADALVLVNTVLGMAIDIDTRRPVLGNGGGGLSGGGYFDSITGLGKAGPNFGFANGGIMTSQGPMPLKRYAAGGIANSPQIAMYGEGRMPEAYVPLPDGRRIPVAMQGGGGTTNVVVNVDAGGTSIQGNAPRGDQLGKALSAAVQAELIKQRRPGGLLT